MHTAYRQSGIIVRSVQPYAGIRIIQMEKIPATPISPIRRLPEQSVSPNIVDAGTGCIIVAPVNISRNPVDIQLAAAACRKGVEP